MSSKTLLYLLFSFSLLLSSCASHSKKYSSKKQHTSRAITKSKKRSSSRSTKPSPTRKEYTQRTAVANFATVFKGTPYLYGGKTPKAFDCSGFVTHVYNQQGIQLSGNSTSLSKLGEPVSLKRAKKGDLIFFGKNGRVSHVAIISQNKSGVLEVIHATSSRGVVKENIAGSSYWTPKILFVRDVIGSEVLAD